VARVDSQPSSGSVDEFSSLKDMAAALDLGSLQTKLHAVVGDSALPNDTVAEHSGDATSGLQHTPDAET